MIFRSIYYDEYSFYLEYNNKSYLKFYYNNDKINLEMIKNTLVRGESCAFSTNAKGSELCSGSLPVNTFEIPQLDHLYSHIFNLENVINNYIIKFINNPNTFFVFFIKNKKLSLEIIIDNVSYQVYQVKNKSVLLNIHISNIEKDQINYLTYIDDIEIDDYLTEGFNFVIIKIMRNHLPKIKQYARVFNWKLKLL
jgi:hypothetical protein